MSRLNSLLSNQLKFQQIAGTLVIEKPVTLANLAEVIELHTSKILEETASLRRLFPSVLHRDSRAEYGFCNDTVGKELADIMLYLLNVVNALGIQEDAFFDIVEKTQKGNFCQIITNRLNQVYHEVSIEPSAFKLHDVTEYVGKDCVVVYDDYAEYSAHKKDAFPVLIIKNILWDLDRNLSVLEKEIMYVCQASETGKIIFNNESAREKSEAAVRMHVTEQWEMEVAE